MAAYTEGPGRFPAAYLTPGTSSFTEFLAAHAPGLLPGSRQLPSAPVAPEAAPHGTTIVAATFAGGVVMAGDRRATMGNVIAQRDIEKVHAADEYSLIGMAGTAGLGIEMIRLFQLELEHYEKIEGAGLSFDGKANRLSSMIRDSLGMALQGLAVVPIFAGYDEHRAAGRVFTYDVTGGRSEEAGFAGTGSGSVFARGALKKLYREGMSADEAVTMTIQALYDAADDDSATGGPDIGRKIFPTIGLVTADGVRMMPEAEVAAKARDILDHRMERPDGPQAPLL
ncbi:proteasome subunit beta [Mangrovactinospora gilvigrisea]|uniref:Proteasome subunit beta n=1 Tax=Mangrovactinospora gilvigrisea TaxID=1428644 RepID=A0A1J7BY52_9ACTN|nr:proteasome subunit beta [Mangrovactinospora gilvigrisea]OIV38409.1 proteasome subunit beta [Mangrovactinospora gilvigrisea]